MALQRVRKSIPFGAGLVTNVDKRASSPPSLDRALDIQFDELAGVQTRYPFAALSTNIRGGGTLSNCRRLFVYRGELLCFTDTTLYSWDARDSAWVSKGTHLAVAVDETTRFSTPDDQYNADRAELNNTVFYAWTAVNPAASGVYVAAIDKTTGNVLLAPTAVSAQSAAPRLVALQTKVLLFFQRTAFGSVAAIALDPASPSVGALTNCTASFQSSYDIVKIPSADTAFLVATLTGGTAYAAVKVTSALALTTFTKARTADGAIAVSVDPTSTYAQVIRSSGTNIVGDLLNVGTGADVFTAQPVGTASSPVNKIACAHRSVQNGGAYRCYAFWSSAEYPASTLFSSKSNWVDTAGALGTQATFVKLMSPASRAFDYNGSVYLWCAFGSTTTTAATGYYSQLFNHYFLYRDDASYFAKAASGVAGGFAVDNPNNLTATVLPGVQLTSGSTGFSWMGGIRRVIPFGTSARNLGYAERAPQEISFTFDDNRARRCVQLGNTLYVTGGEVLQYDGTQLTEVGFPLPPWEIGVSVGGGTTLPAGTYAYKGTWRWLNAAGEIDRSTSGTVVTFTAGGGAGSSIQDASLHTTHKTSSAAGYEIWRTAAAPTEDSPFYKVTSLDPSVTNPNGYIANDTTADLTTACNDRLTDTLLTTHETNPENGTVLAPYAPPAASIILANGSRIFLAGIPGSPDMVAYSKERADGFVVAFNGDLAFSVPPAGGDITALALLNETLIVFRESAIYALPGTGFDNAGGGQNYGPANQVSSDVGAVSMESVALTPMGLIFKSSKGWYVLNRSWQVQYVGGPVKDYDADTVYSVHVLETKHQIRVLTNNRMLVWDYRGAVDAVEPNGKGQWAEWTISDGLHAAIWNGTYHYLNTSGPLAEQSSYSSLTYGQDVETSWIKPAELQGNGRVRWFALLGEWRSQCLVRVRVARDYEYDVSGNPAWFDDKPYLLNASGSQTVGDVLQLRHSPTKQRCEAFKIRVTACAAGLPAGLFTSLQATPVQCLTGGLWNAGVFATNQYPGEYGNGITLSIAFALITSGTFSIELHDNASYDLVSGKWSSVMRTVGLLVKLKVGSSPTVAQLEAAINTSQLLTVASPDALPTKVVSHLAMPGHTFTGVSSSGTYDAPTGEAVRLTGIDLELGAREGIYKRITAAQKG